MMSSRRRLPAALLSLLLLAGSLLGFTASAQAEGAPEIFGSILDAETNRPISNITVRLFTDDFTYIKDTTGKSGIYSFTSPGPGTYRLQFVDARPAYDVKAYAPKLDVPITVDESGSAEKAIKLKRGGSIYGSVKVRGKVAGGASLRAFSDHGHVVSVKADKKGNYALGGLANDNYRVFAHDPKNNWVGSSRLVRSVRSKTFKKASFNLRTKAASFTGGFLKTGGSRAQGTPTVTLVNTSTGDYWVQTIKGGALNLRGLTSGTYTLKVPTTRGYFGGSFALGRLRSGQNRFASVNLSERSGYLVGKVVNSKTGLPLKNIGVRLVDANGATLDEMPTDTAGAFRLGDGQAEQTGVKIIVFAYPKSYSPMYLEQTLTLGPSGAYLDIVNNVEVDLGTIKLVQETPVPPSPSPTTPTATPTATTPTATPTPTPAATATTPAP